MNLNPNPDDPLHKYDYRGAFKAGDEPGPEGHWPSNFKDYDHPNRFVQTPDGMLDTKTGKIIRTQAAARDKTRVGDDLQPR